ncbi:IclR family transcriptional regulator [Polymorphum gilvum]|uniref:Transcriptional regulator, IclR family protein n=1 Tax=Polymorphum gilvum (strain LMG 25793 / CGMCC 1.9160 / SL003B-26A1) TaxID=991905 RepID=F2IYN6_POLGS|nr:IclR family transcriptional regulator [Polymorphum gilvum]ADZ69483.1 Transcriptional regulator, IclR family protein [Polymorphum gilvum SL003B-26A1]
MTARNSLERVLSVLEVFSEDRLEWTPEQLMEELGYSRPTLYRYLKTLKDAGFLISMPGTGFTLGPKVVEMDYLMRKSDPVILNGQKYLERFVGKYPCAALLVRWYGTRILCVASECSTPDAISSYSRGRPMPLARGAISRSIMAFLPRRQLLPLIEQNLADLRAIGLGETSEAVQDSFRKVRKAGVAIAYGEVTPGVVGIAAPVFDTGKSPIASICLTIPGNDISGNRLDQMAAEIRAAAEAISDELSRRRCDKIEK